MGSASLGARVLAAACAAVAIFPAVGAEANKVDATPAPTWSSKAAADYMDGRAMWWIGWSKSQRDHDTFCISCHTALTYSLGRPALRSPLGEKTLSPNEQKIVANITKRVGLWSEVEPFYSDEKQGKPKTAEARGTESILNALILVSYDARDGKFGDAAKQAMGNMWSLQLKDGEKKGGWNWLNFHNEPWEADDSQYWGSTLAAIAIGTTPKSYQATPEVREGLNSLKAFLQTGWQQQSIINQTFLLWASSKVPGLLTKEQQNAVVSSILSKQQEDGGWSTASIIVSTWKRRDGTPLDAKSDGYGTGLASFVLQRAGVSRNRPEMKKALAWLAANQDKQGLWAASSPNKQRDSSSDAWLFMSDAATAYSVLSLTNSGF